MDWTKPFTVICFMVIMFSGLGTLIYCRFIKGRKKID